MNGTLCIISPEMKCTSPFALDSMGRVERFAVVDELPICLGGVSRAFLLSGVWDGAGRLEASPSIVRTHAPQLS